MSECKEDFENDIPVHKIGSDFDIQSGATIRQTSDQNYNDDFFLQFKKFIASMECTSKNETDIQPRNVKPKKKISVIDEPLSLLIRDIRYIDFLDDFVCKIFGINFKTVIIYGRVIPGNVRQENNVRVYSVDDGTELIDVYYPHGQSSNLEDLTNINSMVDLLKSTKNCYNRLRSEKISPSAQLLDDMKILVGIIRSRREMSCNYFSLGTTCFIIGRPFKTFRGRLSLYAYNMYPDTSKERDHEIFWKTFLAYCYETKYSKFTGYKNK